MLLGLGRAPVAETYFKHPTLLPRDPSAGKMSTGAASA